MRQRVARLGIACSLCLTLLTGCGWITNGNVSGVVRGYGGPPTAQDGRLMPNQDIVIVDSTGKRTTVTSDASANYSASLPPGAYVLRCGSGHAFTIGSRQSVTVDCDFQMA